METRLIFGIRLRSEELHHFRRHFTMQMAEATKGLIDAHFDSTVYSWLANGFVIVKYYPLERIGSGIYLILKSYELETEGMKIVSRPDNAEVDTLNVFVRSCLGDDTIGVTEYLIVTG